jgi:hypothetical protein
VRGAAAVAAGVKYERSKNWLPRSRFVSGRPGTYKQAFVRPMPASLPVRLRSLLPLPVGESEFAFTKKAPTPLKTPVAHVLLRAASTLMSMSAKRRDESRRSTQECVRHGPSLSPSVGQQAHWELPYGRSSVVHDASYFGLNNPIVVPSGSAIHAKLPVGISIGPTIFFPPSCSALAR